MLSASASAQSPKNIVVILADDMGLASLHAEHSASGLPTPNLDRLRSQGMSFTDAHSPSAVCSPTRYALLTGRYSWRSRLKSGIVGKWEQPLIAEDRMTIADLSTAAGRRSACIGKWHLGWRWPKKGGGVTSKSLEIDYAQPIGGGALEAGFDHYFGDDVPNWPPYVWIEDDRALALPEGAMKQNSANGISAGPMTEGWSLSAVLPELTRRCVHYIRDRAKEEEGFLLYFSMTSPHTPISPSETFLGQSGVSPYADFLLETDWCVGQVLRALDQYGVADETLVIFTCDNGTSPKANFKTLSEGGVDLRGDWRGHKADVWEGGHRVPFLVRWPGVVEPGSSCRVPICLTDIFATTADAFDVETGEGAGEDSASLLPLFRGEERTGAHGGAIINHSGSGGFALRDGKWKLCLCAGSAGWSPPTNTKQAEKLGLPPVQLYNMDADPGEQKNLALEMPLKVEELTARFRAIVEASPNDAPTWWSRLPWPKPGS
jgi:arylsulfatase A